MSKPNAIPIKTAIYARISADRDAEAQGVDRQQQDCRALAERLGFEVVAVYIDNDISASTKSKKPRPQYADMMGRARRREFGAILAYSNSRLTRRPRELEDLIDLHAATGVLLKTVVSGDDDLSTADGRMVARIKANVDAAEAERTSERTSRAKKQAAEQGRWRGGRRPFGYEADGVTINEKEAKHVRTASKALLAGRSLAAVTRELNEHGSMTSTNRPWDPNSLRAVLLRPRNSGLIHTGTVISRDVEIIGKAAWPALVDPDEWRAIHSLLTSPSRRTQTGSEPRWLGTGIFTCGIPDCDGVMRVTGVGATPSRPKYKRQYHYRCAESAHLTSHAGHTDAFVRQVVAEMLRDERLVQAMSQGETDALQLDRERRSVLVLRLSQTEDDYDTDLIDARRYKSKVEKITSELVEVEARISEGVVQATTSPVLSSADPAAAFLRSPVDVQRAILRTLLKVEVVQAERRGIAWSPARLSLTRVA